MRVVLRLRSSCLYGRGVTEQQHHVLPCPPKEYRKCQRAISWDSKAARRLLPCRSRPTWPLWHVGACKDALCGCEGGFGFAGSAAGLTSSAAACGESVGPTKHVMRAHMLWQLHKPITFLACFW
jgi:hypothetical protein